MMAVNLDSQVDALVLCFITSSPLRARSGAEVRLSVLEGRSRYHDWQGDRHMVARALFRQGPCGGFRAPPQAKRGLRGRLTLGTARAIDPRRCEGAPIEHRFLASGWAEYGNEFRNFSRYFTDLCGFPLEIRDLTA